jgi:H+/Cl- antiporter ClcA
VAWVVAIGLSAGLSSRLFLWWLDHATRSFLTHDWLLWMLPLWGAVLGVVLDQTTRGQGTAHVVAAARTAPVALDSLSTTSRAPGTQLRGSLSPWLAPVALVGTVATHLFGGSVGREGSALQMAGGLTDVLSRRIAHRPSRSWLMTVSISAGFAAVFGIPWAGTVLSCEVSQRRWRHLWDRMAAAWIGHATMVATGYHHLSRTQLESSFDVRWMAVGLIIGLGATFVVGFIRFVGSMSPRWFPHTSLRLTIGGVLTMVVGLTMGRETVGLSLGLLDRGLLGHGDVAAWIAKALATAASVGVGFVGGEVTPLFVLGALGSASVASWLGVSAASGASLGMGTMFAAAARCPFTGIMLSAEVFGWRALPAATLVMMGTLVTRPRRGLYDGASSRGQG